MKKSKTMIIALCVAAYMVSYLCRTNLSVAMDALMEEISLTRSQAGLIGTLYFWTYAGGQLLAGWLCTLIDPKKVVSAGLVLTVACNLFIGFSGAYAAVLVLWMLNGLALALFWPPILQIATNWTTEQEYTRISILLNLPTTVGFLVAWLGLGLLSHWVRWNWMFWLPAGVTVLFLLVWEKWMQSAPAAAKAAQRTKVSTKTEENVEKPSILACLLSMAMLVYAVIVVFQGCIKESINLWAPTLLAEIAPAENLFLLSGFTAIIPMCSTVGLLLTGWMVKKFAQRQQQAMLALLGLGTVAGCLMVLVQKNFMAVALCMGVLLAVVYGVNTILTTLLPLQFARTGNSGAMSSVFNFLSYLGAALGGIAAGTVSELWNWSAVYFMWAVLTGGGFVLLFLYGVLREISFKGIFTK